VPTDHHGLTTGQQNVIATEAADGLIVRRAVERPLYFALAVVYLFVIPEGDLLLLSLPLPVLACAFVGFALT
jgi:hypothetical protein